LKARLIGLCLFGFVVAVQSIAQDHVKPYAGQQTRSIKALSPEDVAGLLNGDGLGMAKTAELNGYPGPAHVLALAEELKLTEAQQVQVRAIFDRMNAEAKRLGAELVERERALDELFALGEITPDQLGTETAAISEIQGRLRSTHLAAHLETKPVLGADQIALYSRLRGYGHHNPPQHQHHHG
jgi:Spy/CpxP family protein refolding chaperone